MRVPLTLALHKTAFVYLGNTFVIGPKPRKLGHILNSAISPMRKYFELDRFAGFLEYNLLGEKFQATKLPRLLQVVLRALLNPLEH